MKAEALCKAFGITLSQFFSDDGEMVELTPELSELVEHWSVLTQKQKDTVWQVIKSYEKKEHYYYTERLLITSFLSVLLFRRL